MHDMGQDFMTTTDTQRGADVEGLVLTVEKLEALLRCAGTTTLEYIGRIESERRDAIARAEAAERVVEQFRALVRDLRNVIATWDGELDTNSDQVDGVCSDLDNVLDGYDAANNTSGEGR
jgi:hypothetical protein